MFIATAIIVTGHLKQSLAVFSKQEDKKNTDTQLTV